MENHLRYTGTMQFEICTKISSDMLERNLLNVLEELNKRQDFDGAINTVEIDRVSLCNGNCLEKIEEVEELNEDSY